MKMGVCADAAICPDEAAATQECALLKDLAAQEQIRESRHVRTLREQRGAGSIMFPERRLLDLSQGRAGLAVDVLRLTDAGLTLGRVVSGGHQIMLEDPENITLLLPVNGQIAVQTVAGEQSFGSGSLILAGAEKRRTRVTAPNGGVFRATTVQIPRNRILALTDAGSDWLRGPECRDIRAIRTRFGQRIAQLLPGLADDVFNRPDRLLTPRALADFVNLIDDFLGDATGTDRGEPRVFGGLREFRRVSQACDIMHARADEALSIAELAGELGLTQRSLQLSFKAIHGVAPREYLQRVRLERARRAILAQGNAASVTQAALDCGFTHLGRFAQVYRRTFGELPSETAARR